MARRSTPKKPKKVDIHRHQDKRRNVPTAEYQAVMAEDDCNPIEVAYERRNRDLDPQLVWRGKDEKGWSDLAVQAPPLFIQEKVHPKVLIDDLARRTKEKERHAIGSMLDLFADFNGMSEGADRAEFYAHDVNWSNRMILGDSLQVMVSLAEREGLRGKVQCIYIDPPYGIKFNSNFQWSTTSRDVKDGNATHITREPEQVKAFRDTWRDGIHSYLTYLRDRLTVARDLLSESGSIFVQIGEENIHLVRLLADEVFGTQNFCREIYYVTTSYQADRLLANTVNMILWYAKDKTKTKSRKLFGSKDLGDENSGEYKWLLNPDGSTRKLTDHEAAGLVSLPEGARAWRHGPLTSQGYSEAGSQPFEFQGKVYSIGNNQHWKISNDGLRRLAKSGNLQSRRNSLSHFMFLDAFPVTPMTNVWNDTKWGFDASEKTYVVQTNIKVVQRCLFMTTDPGDLVLDPTCGSGTTAYVAEQWGRRWITIDTSRVALALARARIMGARYPWYLLADSREGQRKEAELAGKIPSDAPTFGDIRQGFVYERVPHITLKSIANNFEIDVIWEKSQEKLEPLRERLNVALGMAWEEWEIPRDAEEEWSDEATSLHARWWEGRIARQKEIDASISAKTDYEYLYDKPYQDKNKVRVAGPFTVESLSPHRVLGVDENDELIDNAAATRLGYGEIADFAEMILENLETAGVQQAHKEDKITFSSLTPWQGEYVCAEGRYAEGGDENGSERRAAVFIGPEFGTVSRPDLVAAAREAADAGFDVLIACAFSYDAHASEFDKLGRIPVLKARMNADLHMADDLKNTGKGNLFVIFGEPDIDVIPVEIGGIHTEQFQVKINGVDVFHPNTGEVRSDGPEGIACWFIDTDYNEESFFVRHAYFLGANDPYKSLKTTLKAEIDQESWETLHSEISRPFDRPESGRIAVKVINHLGDEVMKVFRV